MDRDVPPRVTYWTGIWRPEQEAISKEVAALRNELAPRAPIISFSHGQRSHLIPSDRTIRLSGRRTWLLRGLAAALERAGDVTHAWGSIDDWLFLKALGRRPVIFTTLLSGQAFPSAHYARVAVFAAESEPLAAQLRDAGVPDDRVTVVYPGVDLEEFAPAPPPNGRFTLLFASSPSKVAEFERRGITLLVEIARACPDIDVVLLWRAWGDERAAARAFEDLNAPSNVVRQPKGTRTMAEVYRASHAVACLFSERFGKSCPNSIVEGFACGRPALVSAHCGIEHLISAARAGVSVPLTLEAAVAGVRHLQSDWSAHAAAARRLAETTFDMNRFVESYRALYARLASR